MQTNHFLTLFFFGTRYDKNGVLGRKGKEKNLVLEKKVVIQVFKETFLI